MKELLENYSKAIESSGLSSELSRYLTSLASSALSQIEALNSFTTVKFHVTLD